MKVYIWSKQQFDKVMIDNKITDENVSDRDEVFFISITDTDKFSDSRLAYFKEDHVNVLNLSFDDCEHDLEPTPTQQTGTKAFTEVQAQKLYEFIKQNRNRKSCVIHCMAGISRSGAVGTFVNGYGQGDWEEFKRTNPFISPNARVSRMLNVISNNDKDNG